MDNFAEKIKNAFRKRLPDRLGSGFERRLEQEQMALAAGRAMSAGKIAVVEAGTGLGKSLAYLIPLLLRCGETGLRALVSTHTRNLQTQLIKKDFPLALGSAGMTDEGAVMMGRRNYACKKAVYALQRSIGDKEDAAADALDCIDRDSEGILENISAFEKMDSAVRTRLRCPASDDVCKGCTVKEDCFLIRSRRKASESTVVFINHALLFTHLSAGGIALGPFDLLVIDEAHHLQEAAMNYLTLGFNRHAITGGDRSLLPPFFDETLNYARGMAAGNHPERSPDIERTWKKFAAAINETHALTELFLQFISRVALEKGAISKDTGKNYEYARSIVYKQGSSILESAEASVSVLKEKMNSLVRGLDDMQRLLDNNDVDNEGTAEQIIANYKKAARELYETFDFITEADDEDYVFFIKCSSTAEPAELLASPVDVSAQLGSLLEECASSVLLTSATLAVDGDFSFILESTGLAGTRRVETHLFDSPFDMNEQRTVLLGAYMPDPASSSFLQEAAKLVIELSEAVSKKILVLCTSRRQVDFLSKLLGDYGSGSGKILFQTEASGRVALLENFKETGPKILFGLSSFWEGVDLPGELLEIVMILKMPFLVPSDPLVNARAERLKRLGENPFTKMFLPDAVLKLKQGAGRLIRTGSDRGVVIILDSRLEKKPYGRVAMQALSDNYNKCVSRRGLIAEAAKVL